MTGKRAYGDGCLVSHALDTVGERWALLIVRELLLGPKRYSNLQAGLRGASSNVLSQRLRELEDAGVVTRRKLGPPTSSWVYELTDWGRGLGPVLVQLGRWSMLSPVEREGEASIDALVLALRARFDPGPQGSAADDSYVLHIDDDTFSIHVAAGELDVARGEQPGPDAVIATDAATFTTLVRGRQSPEQAIAAGLLTVTGDPQAAQRLFRATMYRLPASPPGPAA